MEARAATSAALQTGTKPAEAVPPRQVVAVRQDWTLFVESAPLIRSMVEDIRNARQRVWVEIYIFGDDALGREIAEALKDRARAGLDVRVLYDAIGSQNAPRAFFREMQEAGVQVHAFHTFWEAL